MVQDFFEVNYEETSTGELVFDRDREGTVGTSCGNRRVTLVNLDKGIGVESSG